MAIGQRAFVKLHNDALVSLSGNAKNLAPARSFYHALQNCIGTTDGIQDFLKNGVRIFSPDLFPGLSVKDISELVARTIPIRRRLCFIFVLSEYARPGASLPTTNDAKIVSEKWRANPLVRVIHLCLDSSRASDKPFVTRYEQIETMKTMLGRMREYDALYLYKSCHGLEIFGVPVSLTYEPAVLTSDKDYINELSYWLELLPGRYGFGFYDMCQAPGRPQSPHCFGDREPPFKPRGAYAMVLTSSFPSISIAGFNQCSKFTLLYLACHPNPTDLKPTPFDLPNGVTVKNLSPQAVIAKDREWDPIRTERCILDALEWAYSMYYPSASKESDLPYARGNLNLSKLVVYTPRLIDLTTPVELAAGPHRNYVISTTGSTEKDTATMTEAVEPTELGSEFGRLTIDETDLVKEQTASREFYSGNPTSASPLNFYPAGLALD